ncbi:MAG: hypothetical protein EB059_09990 [Alphaproteobacteria bacterium]|nr:hypothetical protein [Alphaproteobacteria bacterium]
MTPQITLKGWAPAKLGDIVQVLDNERIPINNEEREKRLSKAITKYPYYGATGQVGEIDNYIFDRQAILLGEDAAPFLDFGKSKAYLVDGKFWVNNHAHILRGHVGIDNKFVCYQLNCINYRGFVSGTTRLKLTQGSMKSLPLMIAPANEQKRIVDKIEELFSALDKGEALLKQVQQQLATYRQSVLKAAVTGELTKEWREQNKQSLETGEALLQRILKFRRENWRGRGNYEEPSAPRLIGLSTIPETWMWATLAQITFIKGGVTVDKKRTTDDPITVPYLRVANVQNGYIDLTDVKTITLKKSKIEQYLLKNGDILLNEGGDLDKLGRGWVWQGEIETCIHQNHVFRARPVFEQLSSKYISYYANAFGQSFFMEKGKQSVNLASISLTAISGLPIPIPPIEEQLEIVELLSKKLSEIEHLVNWCETELARSATLRHSILKAAFSGQLVPQDPADEPASELLARIKANREADQAKRPKKVKTTRTPRAAGRKSRKAA